ncbi:MULTISPECIES: 4-amino-4-deoxy-L-arabinose-phosphoundecaprenol flippase subunit ArnF [Pseudomonas]|jgi:undecaprenyl phosphate-alpha-L-ara4N flippase subunit ArnF|uniref:4-amino-4-deoxy-L-arabinose-phosphoundecaprenol flippase subunit ArnF n=2 Tax=Pseudomonas TaxID=286 RepID=UPI000281CEA0|nr:MULTISPECIES: 4-amino-4-deoxy-L-arabinose-phosphoundecaprenol flippase subunit ArnF [Pseudomonas]MDP9061902.1 4-amino-4-deoxy-L-arabinose-phosphoundecaprenol flippase subunit ArnF [Pseudomonadota bacterium]MDE1910602.1 4-amino-4-deoxy-L-arabinose-phosphoundecaprenol flippase subunit ArnF [Pseudomonas sp.]MDE2033903.1 4-amino-4-deoxy-L-arabinose-phosphoundecaprenol flippase subunit ArnF [Pseudomonas sp.]MDE2189413.1 4-amino-4-deoxy-L-arabinose-phosphoundecaprenol flippase subunit ArnF [Pseudo
MSRARGFALALGSVALVSGAQLGMRWSMTRLPLPAEWLTALDTGAIDLGALGVVILAIIAYALSMLCWLGALKDLPLGRAYSLLSISYALVYLLAASLPVFNEHFSLSKTAGVALVILGVLTINSRRASTTSPRNAP